VHMQRPDWDQRKVPGFLALYLVAQLSPLLLIAWKASRFNKVFKATLDDGKRRAVLKRRGIFEFISPLALVLAGLSYILLVALILYIRQHPFPGFGGFTNLAVITPCYALNALLIYGALYGKNRNPVATHADRLFAMGVVVKTCVYTSIAGTLFNALILTLSELHLRRWELFALSVFFVITLLLCSIGVIPRGKPGSALGSNGPLPPGTPNLSV